jgi:Uma2 family endonuclease
MPRIPSGHRFEVVPDWICEILSSSTESKDREIKMPIYAKYGVAYAWLLNPRSKAIEAYYLERGKWLPAGRFGGDTAACIPPFDAVSIDLAVLWDGGSGA